jgi:hypothetical protein
MKFTKCCPAGLFCLFSVITASSLLAQDTEIAANASVTVNPGCNGNRFNLEPRLNAGPQNSESVDFLPNRVSPGVDLVVGAGNDQAANGNTSRLGGFDGYYVHRQGTQCVANFEGTVSPAGGVLPIDPTVVADAARDAFFFSDTLFGSQFAEVARTTAATLMSPTACPNGTRLQGSNPKCWPVVGLANFTNSGINSATLLDSHIAVDPRTSGTGAGDVYVVTEFLNTTNFPSVSNIQILACTNVTVSCGTPVVVSGTDPAAERPYVQVRSDGTITISYWTFTKPNDGSQPNPIDIKFLTCAPQGAPKAPTCTAASLVATSSVPGLFAPGGSGFHDFLFPKHANRVESGGKTFTTFLVYDRCRSIVGKSTTATPVCSKLDVVVTFSTNGGATWSTPQVVETVGHQFFGTIRNDTSTQTINIAYYSTQEDQFLQRVKIRLRQIAAGSIVLGAANVLTTVSTDPDAGIQDVIEPGGEGFINFGDRIGLAAAGTGTAGQSKIYVHYTWNNVFGTYNGIAQPDQNNTLIGVSY